ncbi:MAG TPA: class I SAM-dependent methyltransferase, partial [Tepidisphaeraceae bacterium]|nr:class I SAM-dependent methyltransferase [Tepidisphaeraceae bacterium]
HFSATFNKFAHELASRWIEKYHLRGKTILEVGCGKGDFLSLMCEVGDCRGIGIDPSYQPSRTSEKLKDRLRFIVDHYSEKYTNIEADVIMCRHTLEHIGPTLDFVKMIRRAIGQRKDMLVLFELPDVTRVLKEFAFWDVYYEHCSYFSPGSLARVFRAAGFDLLELGRDYGDQYLLLAGKPTDAPTKPSLPLENDLDEMRNLAAAFKKKVSPSIAGWRDMILTAKAEKKKVVLWSALSKAVSFLTTTKVGDAIEYGVDINPQRQGRFLPVTGQQIVEPKFLATYKPDYVILMNPIYVPEVKADLAKMGVKAQVLAVGLDQPGIV